MAEAHVQRLQAEDKALRAKQEEQRANVLKGRPTPTQEECDLIKLGEHPELSEDGSGPDPNDQLSHREAKHQEAGKGQPYSTRQATAQHQQRTTQTRE